MILTRGQKAAATRLGLTYEAYASKIVAGLKWCGWCKDWVNQDQFESDRSRSDGLSTWCNSCRTIVRERRRPGVRKWTEKNRTLLNEKARKWRRSNPESYRNLYLQDYQRNKQKQSARQKLRYAANPEMYREKARSYRLKNFKAYLVKRLKKKAELLNLPFNLTTDDIVIPELCPALGIRLDLSGRGQSPNRPSVDRLNPAKGYIKGNIAVISMRANTIKNNACTEEIAKVLQFMRRNKCP